MPRILNILHAPWLGGTENAYLSACNELSNAHEVFCLIPKNAAINPSIEKNSKLNIFKDNRVYKNSKLLDFIFIKKLCQIIKSNAIEIVIVNNGRMTKLAKKACFGICPLVSVNHGTNPEKTALADYAFVLNKATYKELTQKGFKENKIFIIPNFIEMPILQSNKSKSNIPVIGVMGRFSKEKGFNYFLEALKILKSKKVEFKSLIAGDGEEFENLKCLVKQLSLENDVEFCGWVEDKKSFFDKLDIFCLPSNYEAFGLVLLEAMKYKTPIIATDCNGPLDIIEDGIDGLLCKRKDSNSIAESIEKIINNLESRLEFSEKAYKKMSERYTNIVVGKQLNDAINKIYSDYYKK